MDYYEYKANCVQAFVSAILSTGGPVTETLIEAAGYKVVVHLAFKIADYIVDKLKVKDPEWIDGQQQDAKTSP